MKDNTELSSRYNGYYRAVPQAEDVELTHVGPGTPCGDYLRRFWQPVCISEQLGDLPLGIRILGEDLVVFRDLSGDIGLLHRHCSHRRASLEYGVIAEHGIRCCYHGWLYDVDGTILETPGEAENSPIRHTLCHGAYPVLEYNDVVFAYMGPADQKPVFPIYDSLEIPANEMVPYVIDMPCNWLQVNENPMDPYHAVYLHSRATGVQFTESWNSEGVVEWHWMPHRVGIFLTDTRRCNEFLWARTAELFPPNFAQPSDFNQDASSETYFARACASKWIVPVDNTHCKLIAWRHFNEMIGGTPDREKIGVNKIDFVGQTGSERTAEQRQREPGDYEAQVGQGEITVHAEERLGRTDTGVGMLRGLLRRQIRAVANGDSIAEASLNADGKISTFTGDFVVKIPRDSGREQQQQTEFGRQLAKILVSTMPLGFEDRQAEVKRQLQALK
ncbi:MAG: phenylpropionate dioxygenase-like ring-hydroxylating dioxygenase large terminal subunit [Gammaproteobacteria bacterium]|jgi:phenylpropionate dioxygenase-like ring-hydroxylating dioxygenase large terminal subunit